MASEPGRQEAESIGAVYDRLGPVLFRYALMLLADHHEAEDAIQHVFAALVKRGVSGLDSVEGYLRASVRNECYSALKRRRSNGAGHAADALIEAVTAADERPDVRLAIEEGLRSLPAEQREVVHLKVYEGRTFQEIADLSEESINTVASRYRYAIDKLKQTLGTRST
jgi:RNA polymerase sigma-70 factor (ECF subfamily)